MSDESRDGKAPAHRRAQEHLKRILRKTAVAGAALTLGPACESCQPVVCDPLPPPICDRSPTTADFLNQGKLESQAQWEPADGGELAVSVRLHLWGEGESITFAADPGVIGARLLDVRRDGAEVTFRFVPLAGVSRVEAVIQLDCATRPEALKLGFDVGTPESGRPVPVTSLE